MVIASRQIERDIQFKESEWSRAYSQVSDFERVVPESMLDPGKARTIRVDIPNDHHWLLIARHLKPQFFILRNERRRLIMGPLPENPLEPLAVEIEVNGKPAPLTVQDINNQRGYVVPIHLGDRVDLKLSSVQGALVGDGTLTWGVDFERGNDDYPEFGWGIDELGADLLFWGGLVLLGAGTLIVFLRGNSTPSPSNDPAINN